MNVKTLEWTVVRITYKILFFIWFGFIVFFSVMTNSAGDRSFLARMALTKSGFFQHAAGYLVLSALAWLTFKKNNIWIILAGILILGVVLEIIQYALPTRSFNIYDLLANLIGVLVVVIKILFDQKRRSYGNY